MYELATWSSTYDFGMLKLFHYKLLLCFVTKFSDIVLRLVLSVRGAVVTSWVFLLVRTRFSFVSGNSFYSVLCLLISSVWVIASPFVETSFLLFTVRATYDQLTAFFYTHMQIRHFLNYFNCSHFSLCCKVY